MAGPMRRAAVTDTATEAPKNVWSRARPLHNLTLLTSHGALNPRGRHLQRRPLSVSQAANRPEGEAELGVATVGFGRTWRRTTKQTLKGQRQPKTSAASMATASTSGQSAFGLGRKKKNPGLMDQISKFFGGDKKKRSKVSIRAFKRIVGFSFLHFSQYQTFKFNLDHFCQRWQR